MHKIYTNKGSFDFLYQFPSIIYSSLISMGIISLLRLLAFSNDTISDFKQDKSKNDIKIRTRKLRNKIRIKTILYFILSIIFLLFFWYYLSMFGAVYRNTQNHLINDTLISFDYR